jgi:hypothetical protein
MSEGDPAAGGTAARAGNRVIGHHPNTTIGDPAPSLDSFGWPREYHRPGWRILPITPGRKRPVMRGWQHFKTTGDGLPGLFGGEKNVGFMLDDDRADVHLDCPEAVVLANLYLATLGDVRETSKAEIAADLFRTGPRGTS